MNALARLSSLALLVSTLGCSGSTPTRNLTGQLGVGSYSVQNPVVVARSTSGRTFVASIAATGAFKLTVPTGASYRLALADRAGGTLTLVSRITWPVASRARWARIERGPTLRFGLVHPRGLAMSSTAAIHTASDGSGGDTGGSNNDGNNDDNNNDEGDSLTQCGSQTDESGDNTTSQSDNCEEDSAQLCDAGNENESEGDAQDQPGVAGTDGAQTEAVTTGDPSCSGGATTH